MLSLLFFIQRTIVLLLSTTPDSGIVVGDSLISLLLALVVGLIIDDSLSSLEFDLDFFLGRVLSLHPWMGEDFFEFGSVRRVDGHHLLEEILELGGVDVIAFFCVFVSSPEDFGTIGCQKAVMRVLWICAAEWWSLGQNNEENDGRGKEVNTWTRVRFA